MLKLEIAWYAENNMLKLKIPWYSENNMLFSTLTCYSQNTHVILRITRVDEPGLRDSKRLGEGGNVLLVPTKLAVLNLGRTLAGKWNFSPAYFSRNYLINSLNEP